MAKNMYNFIDLFSGCGGLSEGFMASGHFRGVAHLEWELPMVKTLRRRLVKHWGESEVEAEKHVIHYDIQDTNFLLNPSKNESLPQFDLTNDKSFKKNGLAGLVEGKTIDVVIGGPPCQAYSIAGRAQDKDGMKNDYRNYLFESFLKVVTYSKPKFFVFENVPGMLSACPGGTLVVERIHKAVTEAGYKIPAADKFKDFILDSSEFGVPQKRRRVIIIGVRKDLKITPEDILEEIKKFQVTKVKTVKQAIGKYPKFIPLPESEMKKGHAYQSVEKKELAQHEPRFHNPRDISIFKDWVKLEMNSMPMEDKIEFYNKKLNKNSKHAKYRNLNWDKPSPTIVAHLNKDGLMFIHPDAEQARTITVREAATLQSFPENYEFIGNRGVCYKMIGNAVPPKLAECIANGLISKLKSR